MVESAFDPKAQDLPMPNQATSIDDATSQASSATHDVSESVKGFGSPAMSSPAMTPNKHLDFGAESKLETEPVTPTTPFTPRDEAVDYNQFVLDTLMWTNKVRASFYLVIGVCLILAIKCMLQAGTPLLTVICQLTLAQMALNFMRQAISPSLQEKATWMDSAWTAAGITKLAAGIKTMAALHDKHLSASSPHKHLLIAGALWIVSMLARLITASNLVLVVYIGTFVVPLLYTTYRNVIDPAAKDAFTQAKARLKAVDRRAKAAGIMVLILLLGYRMSTVDLVIAGFVVCVYARWQLPGEVAEISKKIGPIATPLGKTAAQVGGHIGKAMEGAMDKFELTPTPMKKKKV